MVWGLKVLCVIGWGGVYVRGWSPWMGELGCVGSDGWGSLLGVGVGGVGGYGIIVGGEELLTGISRMFAIIDPTVRVKVRRLFLAISSKARSEPLSFLLLGTFERRRYMNVVVHKARHPQLKEYIHSTVTALQPFIQKGVVEIVAVVFFNTDNIPIEKFVFNLKVNQLSGLRVEEIDLMFSLRSFLMKLSVSESLTKGLPPGMHEMTTGIFSIFAVW
ncbi:hypothetical protein Sjap_003799 [Stephania japonica]|uniref:HORMA domain-containing protein n=1 Tax=Stephania japonica TaxID=461633 RepID=A0AAP0KR80_9MAGN